MRAPRTPEESALFEQGRRVNAALTRLGTRQPLKPQPDEMRPVARAMGLTQAAASQAWEAYTWGNYPADAMTRESSDALWARFEGE